MIWIGIDPGLDGAIAGINDEGLCHVTDAPTAHDGRRRRYLISEMRREILHLIKHLCVDDQTDGFRAAIERVHSMPKQGVASSFSFGEGFGLWQGLLAGLSIPFDLVEPQAWKKVLLSGAGKDKDASRIRAQQLFPDAPLSLKKHHGRAEALLIAEYRRRQG